MNHQPFRSWLFSEGELTTDQAQALQDHLQSCEACSQLDSSWKELQALIDRSAQLEPAPGFVGRWQVRLVEQQHHQQQLRSWYAIGATALIVVFLSVILAIQINTIIQAPGLYLAAMFDRFIGVLSIFFTIQNFISSFSLPGLLYTLAGIVIVFGMISFMSVLWLATYRKISMARREA